MAKLRTVSMALALMVTLGAAAAAASSAASAVLSGKVVDSSTGEPLYAASITVKGTPLRASSDGQGFFTIADVPTGIATLQVQRTGYKSRELSVSVSPTDPTSWTIALLRAKH